MQWHQDKEEAGMAIQQDTQLLDDWAAKRVVEISLGIEQKPAELAAIAAATLRGIAKKQSQPDALAASDRHEYQHNNKTSSIT
jgi:hypothetical protein